MPKKAAEEKVEKAPEIVEVKLPTDHQGKHTVYLPMGRVEFEKGIAHVTPEVADELRKLGVIE